MFGDNYLVRLATIIISRKLFLFYDLIMPLMIDTVWAEAMLIIKISSLKNTVFNCRELAKVIVAEQFSSLYFFAAIIAAFFTVVDGFDALRVNDSIAWLGFASVFFRANSVIVLSALSQVPRLFHLL